MQNLCVVVTGASAGIGRAAALAFGKRGCRVALLARGVEGLAAAKREIEAAGGQALVIPTDVAAYEQVEAAAERVEKEFGPIDVWINNAMATIFSPFEEITPEDFERATQVTYLGAVWGTKAALKRMKPRNRGTIVQIGSALAYRSIPLQSPYCGAKSALRGFTDSLRSELIHDKSRVHLTMVHLCAFNTPQFEWGRTSMDRQPQPVPPIFQAGAVGRLPDSESNSCHAHHARPARQIPGIEGLLGTASRYTFAAGASGQFVSPRIQRSWRARTLRCTGENLELASVADDASLACGRCHRIAGRSGRACRFLIGQTCHRPY
jgi:NAD(P)-dependent dehydrogenase (short-subunit alcohol dehydrogenase family)